MLDWSFLPFFFSKASVKQWWSHNQMYKLTGAKRTEDEKQRVSDFCPFLGEAQQMDDWWLIKQSGRIWSQNPQRDREEEGSNLIQQHAEAWTGGAKCGWGGWGVALTTGRLVQTLQRVWLGGAPDSSLTPCAAWNPTCRQKTALSCSETLGSLRESPVRWCAQVPKRNAQFLAPPSYSEAHWPASRVRSELPVSTVWALLKHKQYNKGCQAF